MCCDAIDISTVKVCFFFFNDTATTEIYTLSLHDALPICRMTDYSNRAASKAIREQRRPRAAAIPPSSGKSEMRRRDRKSTRLNSSHANISYAVFCLKKKKRSDTRLRFLFPEVLQFVTSTV